MDAQTSAEVVIFTIPSFIGHGIKKDNQEIQDRDTLANYIFNEVTLGGIKGIGKKDKDNGVLVLYSLDRDAGGQGDPGPSEGRRSRPQGADLPALPRLRGPARAAPVPRLRARPPLPSRS